ncbi:MAG TPA: deoxyribose-phosphate aldolase [Vampirovibrionales bacterium]
MTSPRPEDISLNYYIDHTLLDPLAGEKEIEHLCNEVIDHNFATACIHPFWTKFAAPILHQASSRLSVVADFPFGASISELRIQEVEHTILNGADEIDLVAPLMHIKKHNWNALFQDINSIRKLIGTRAILKVIIEVSLFDTDTVIQASRICAQAGAQTIKTSTGIINKRPTELSDIKAIKEGLMDFHDVEIKASAGIKTKEQALQFIQTGVSRIGTSAALQIIKNERTASNY